MEQIDIDLSFLATANPSLKYNTLLVLEDMIKDHEIKAYLGALEVIVRPAPFFHRSRRFPGMLLLTLSYCRSRAYNITSTTTTATTTTATTTIIAKPSALITAPTTATATTTTTASMQRLEGVP